MKTYHNAKWGFALTLPEGWGEPSLFSRVLLFFRYLKQSEQPEFLGPFGSSLKFEIATIHPVPGLVEQQKNLARLAQSCGHRALDVNVITANGKDHATLLLEAPVGEVKIYSLIVGRTEYLVTARGRFHEADAIVRSFRMGK